MKRSFTSGIKKIIRKHSDCIYACSETLQVSERRIALYRILRSNKNRFGSTAEIGIFEMMQSGLREVTNPSEIMLSGNPEKLSGVAVASVMEGIRSLMIEVQALVTTAAYGTPQRSVNGYDAKRLNMLLAVIEKRLGVKIYTKDADALTDADFEKWEELTNVVDEKESKANDDFLDAQKEFAKEYNFELKD